MEEVNINALHQWAKWFQEKERNLRVIKKRSKTEVCFALKRLGIQLLFIS